MANNFYLLLSKHAKKILLTSQLILEVNYTAYSKLL